MTLTWHLPAIVVTHALLMVWAYRRGMEHAADALVQRFEGHNAGLREAVEDIKP